MEVGGGGSEGRRAGARAGGGGGGEGGGAAALPGGAGGGEAEVCSARRTETPPQSHCHCVCSFLRARASHLHSSWVGKGHQWAS